MSKKGLTPRDLEYYNDMSEREIKKLMSNLVDDLNFEAAKVAKVALSKAKVRDENKLVNDIQRTMEEGVTNAKEQWDNQVKLVNEEFEISLLHLRNRISKAFATLREIHCSANSSIEERRAAEIIKAAQRPVKEQKELEDMARQIGHTGDLDGAINARKKAELAREKVMKERRSKIDEKFNETRAIATEKQRRQLTLLTEKMNKRIAELEKEKKEKIIEKEKAFAVACKAIEQKQVTIIMAESKKGDTSGDVVEEIHKSIKQIVLKITGRDDILPDAAKGETPTKMRSERSPARGNRAKKPRKTATTPKK